MKAIEKKEDKKALKKLGFDSETVKIIGDLLKTSAGAIHFYLENTGPHMEEEYNKRLSDLHSDSDLLKLKHSLVEYKVKTLEQILALEKEPDQEEARALAKELNALKHDVLVLNSETIKVIQEIKRGMN